MHIQSRCGHSLTIWRRRRHGARNYKTFYGLYRKDAAAAARDSEEECCYFLRHKIYIYITWQLLRKL